MSSHTVPEGSLENGYRHIIFDDLDSTNSECIRRAQAGDNGKLWVTAKTQNAGKARRGREWVSETGNLFASLLLINEGGTLDNGTLPFVASLAVTEAIIDCVAKSNASNELPVTIKWPNDVLFSGQKISGILLESTALPDGRQAVIIGCGINCAHSPDQPLYPATSLAEEGFDICAADLFSALSNAMDRFITIWNAGKEFGAIRQAWLKKAAGIGEQITARFDDHSETGKFVGIDQQGRLILATDDGEKLISAADIFFGIDKKAG